MKPDVTYLVPSGPGPIHLLKQEEVTGTRTHCEVKVRSGRGGYGHRTTISKADRARVCAPCVQAEEAAR